MSFLDAPNGTPGGRDHTGRRRPQKIYWLCTNTRGRPPRKQPVPGTQGMDGKGGMYVATYKGSAFKNGTLAPRRPARLPRPHSVPNTPLYYPVSR